MVRLGDTSGISNRYNCLSDIVVQIVTIQAARMSWKRIFRLKDCFCLIVREMMFYQSRLCGI